MVVGQVEGLAQVADAAGGRYRHLTVVWLIHPGDDLEQRGLAGAVLADDSGALAGPDAEGELVKDAVLAVGLRDSPEGKLCRQRYSNRNYCCFKLA
ncbi:hypothetical protein GCM10023096_66080 [Nonomuraea ferruginea]